MGRLAWNFQLSFLLIFLLAMNVNAGGAIAGKVTILKGKVFFERGGQKIQIKKDDTVLESDTIEAEVGTARITMIDSNLIDIYPKTKITISKYVYKPNQDQKEVDLKIDFGKIKSTVIQKYDGAKSKFQIKTPAAVAGVRGTVFTAEYDKIKKVAKIVTIEGLVAVAKLLEDNKQSAPVFVRPDQVVKVDAEQTNSEQPRDLTPEERDSRKKEDKDLGYQYDPKNEATPPSANNPPPRPPVAGGPAQGQPNQPPVTAGDTQSNPPATTETANRGANPEPPKEPVKQIKESVTSTVKNSSDRQQQQQQQLAQRRQKQLEDEQARKQKQLEEEMRKRQQLEAQRAEAARRLAETTIINRPPATTVPSTPSPGANSPY